MNKHIIKALLFAAVAMPLTTSCELDQFPEGSIPAEKSWEKVSDAQNYQVGLFASLRGLGGGSNTYVTEAQADLFNGMDGNGGNPLQREHEWNFTTAQFAGNQTWAGGYSTVANANNIIVNIDNITPESEEDEAVLADVKGTAYFARAYAYASMVLRYCDAYDAATAESKLGLPIVETVDVNAKPARANLQKTYEFILGDIAQAETLLEGMDGDITRPGYSAVIALKARVLLNMKRYDDALTAATSIMGAYPLCSAADLAGMWVNDESSEIIYQPVYNLDERPASYSPIFISYDTGTEAWNPYFLPTQGLMDLYEEGDARKEIYFTYAPVSARGLVDEGYIFTKYPGNPALRKAGETEISTFYNMPKMFRASELYLIAAEASLFKDDNEGALKFLNEIRKNRYPSELEEACKLSKEAYENLNLDEKSKYVDFDDYVVKQMKEEWVREMVGEGFRLDCLKRWGEGVKRMAPQEFTENILTNIPESEYTKLNIQPGDALYFKMTWEIPTNDLESNDNLIGNWK